MMTMTRARLLRAVPMLAIAGLALSTAACASRQSQRLALYDFAGSTVAVVYFPAPTSELITGRHSTNGNDPVAAVVSAGSRIAVEVEGRRARARLDTAATRADLAARMAERTLERTSRYMGAHAIGDRAAADYLLEVDVRSVELDARGERAMLRLRSEVVLLDRHSGRAIWSARVRSHGPLTPAVDGGAIVPADAVTAGVLTTVDVYDFQRSLEQLADLSGDWISREFRDALTTARRRR